MNQVPDCTSAEHSNHPLLIIVTNAFSVRRIASHYYQTRIASTVCNTHRVNATGSCGTSLTTTRAPYRPLYVRTDMAGTFECDDVINRAHVSRKRERERSRLPHREVADWLLHPHILRSSKGGEAIHQWPRADSRLPRVVFLGFPRTSASIIMYSNDLTTRCW